jgi:hypothetical protein
MRYVLTAVAAIAVGGFFASSASAEPMFYPGGPVQNGGMCQVYTGGDQYYGYLAPCPNAASAVKPGKKKRMKAS